MDIELARTFLTVTELGSFLRAADRLHVTQSTVSNRIKVLEEQLGRPLFVRSKAGVALTPAGFQFQRHADALVRVWQRARQEVALGASHARLLVVGAQFSLWDGFVQRWLGWMRKTHPHIAIRAEVASNDVLIGQAFDGLLDIAVVYTPQTRGGFRVEQLFQESLVLVSTQPDRGIEAADDYVFVDWGPAFQAEHASTLSTSDIPGLSVNMGALALDFILENGGAGYFPIRLVKQSLDEGRLFFVHKAPRFRRPAFVVYCPDENNEALDVALQGLFRMAKSANRPTGTKI